MQELLDRLREKVESRGAEDFLEDLVIRFNGYFGNFLIRKQLEQDCNCGNADCELHGDSFGEMIDEP